MPFKSQAQRRWMYANEPKMARRWERHTPDKDLPERVEEEISLAEMANVPDWATDQDEEDEAQQAAFDDSPEETEEPPGTPVPGPSGDIAKKRKAFLDALDDDDDVAAPVEEPAPEPEEPEQEERFSLVPSKKPADRPAEYSRKMKSAAMGDPDLYDTQFKDLRPDIERFSEDIDDLHDAGYTYGAIARMLNDTYDLKTRPGPQRKKHTPGARSHDSFRCPECKGPLERTASSWKCQDPKCNREIPRAITPEQVADYLRSVGKIKRGAASGHQSMDTRMQHDHDPNVWDEKCPACNWMQGGFDSEYGESEADQTVKETLMMLGEDQGTFTGYDAIQAVSDLDLWKMDVKTPYFPPCPNCLRTKHKEVTKRVKDKRGNIKCPSCGFLTDPSDLDNLKVKWYQSHGYSDSKIPKGFKNLADYVIWTLSNSPEFEYMGDGKGFIGMDDPWRYVGSEELKENRRMGDTCASCEQGHHQRCRDESCDCCGGSPSLHEMFGEAMNRPQGSTPFQDWSKLGQNGMELKKQADSLKGSAYQTQDGQILFYKDQMQTGEQPMVADMTQGIWSPMNQQATPNAPQQTQQGQQPTMGSVFSSKTTRE